MYSHAFVNSDETKFDSNCSVCDGKHRDCIHPHFAVGDKVTDRDGFAGTVTAITHFKGSHWYDIRFERGSAVRYDADLHINEASA